MTAVIVRTKSGQIRKIKPSKREIPLTLTEHHICKVLMECQPCTLLQWSKESGIEKSRLYRMSVKLRQEHIVSKLGGGNQITYCLTDLYDID